MTITKIERQKKNKTRCSVFVDGAYAFSVGEDVYARFLLHTGQTLSDDERQEIERAENESSVKRAALKFRSYRPRSAKEIVDHLRRKGYDEPTSRQAVLFLQENRLLDDAEYARMICRDRLLLKPVGKQTMKQLLLKKGIDRSMIDTVLSEHYSDEMELSIALKEGEKKFKRIASLPPLVQRKRLFEHLLRRGYDASLSHKIVSRLVQP